MTDNERKALVDALNAVSQLASIVAGRETALAHACVDIERTMVAAARTFQAKEHRQFEALDARP